jgi:anti-sigma factor RsiW
MMNWNQDHTEWTDRLSAYIDGDLEPVDRRAVEEHLAGCGECRQVLEELRAVVSKAGDLPERHLERDLWAGIAATIQAPIGRDGGGSKVIALPIARRHAEPETGRVSTSYRFTRPQLAAASIALIAVSSLVTWAAGPGLGVRAAGDASPALLENLAFATGSEGAPPALAEELQLLERALAESASALDPNTVRVLERNLAVIEQAIVDSRRALEMDPGNDFLSEHLERVYERKLSYLRDAARVAEWSS